MWAAAMMSLLGSHSLRANEVQQPPTATLDSLQAYLAAGGQLSDLPDQPFCRQPLSKEEAAEAKDLLVAARTAFVREARQSERRAEILEEGALRMRFSVKVFGDPLADGRSLYISLHGGGGAPSQVNDSQWQNQQRLYELQEGVYVTPRAPTDTWNLWHQAHIDRLLDRLIDVMATTEGVDRNRVYLMGYSAGGDGVYQLAPRMADRWAAAAMMAGHPNDASPVNLRNLPFTLHVGERDTAYNRSGVAREWQQQLASLQTDDPGGYEHSVTIHPGLGHWMNRLDAAAVPWMATHTRNPTPKRIVWKQDDVLHSRLYWLSVESSDHKTGATVIAQVNGQRVTVTSSDISQVTVCLDDRLVDLDQPVSFIVNDRQLPPKQLPRTIASLATTLCDRGDPDLMFPTSIKLPLAQP